MYLVVHCFVQLLKSIKAVITSTFCFFGIVGQEKIGVDLVLKFYSKFALLSDFK